MATKASSAVERSRTSHAEFKMKIIKAYPRLMMSLTKHEVECIADMLYSLCIIMPEEHEQLQVSSTATESARVLCNIILKKNDVAMEIFFKALHEISRNDLLAQLEIRIEDHEDLAMRQREEYDLQQPDLENQEEKLQRQQEMLNEKEKSLTMREVEPENRLKSHEDLAQSQIVDYDLRLQHLKNQEEKLEHLQLIQKDKEKNLTMLQEQLEKRETELEIKVLQQLADRMSIEKEKNDLLQRQQSLDEKEKESLEKQMAEHQVNLVLAKLEKRIKDLEDQAKKKREDCDLPQQHLQNQEEKLEHQLVIRKEKEKSLTMLRVAGSCTNPAVVSAEADEPSPQDQDALIDVFITPTKPNMVHKLLNDNTVYKMTKPCRGKVIVINNEVFNLKNAGSSENLPLRHGSTKDSMNVNLLFGLLHFEVNTHNNKTAQAMRELIANEARDDVHKEHGMFVLVILSHGTQGSVYGADGELLQISEIKRLLSTSQFPHMAGKPKLILLQACQGERHDGQIDNDGLLETDARPHGAAQQRPELADMLIAYPTAEGCYSFRNPKLGSWFIRAVVDVFMRKAYTDHILDMLTEVRRKVCEMSKKKGFLQGTYDENHLQKKLYLLPGWTESP